jgi:hypothetical protein
MQAAHLTVALEADTLSLIRRRRLAASQCLVKLEGSLAVFLFVLDIA